MALPRYRSFLAVGKETTALTPGGSPTAALPANFKYLPVNSLDTFDDIKYLDDLNWRGSMVNEYGAVQGNIHSQINFGGDLYPDTIGFVYAGVLGDYVYTAGTPSQHAMSVKNSGTGQATSYTLTDYNGYNQRQYAGCMFGSVDTKFNAEGLLEYTATAQGFQSSVNATALTTGFSALTPVPVWTGVTTIGGSVTPKLAEGNVNITRSLTPIFTVDGSQSPYQIFQGAVSAEGSLKLIFEDDTDYTRYLTNTQPSLDFTFSTGTGASQLSVQLHLSKAAFTVAKVDRSKDFVELDVTYKGIATTSDGGSSGGYSPIKVTILNATASAAYA